MLVSGRITRKSVKSGPYGDKVSFLVGGNWLSAFASDKKLDQDAKDLLRSLVEGEEAEFTIVEAPNKNDPSKPYLNIAGIIKVNRLDTGEAPDYPAPPVQPSGQSRKEQPEIGKIVGTCTQYAVLYANQKMAITKEVVSIDEVKEIAAGLARFQAELITTWGE